MPLVVCALGGVEPEGTHLERRKKLETSSHERYKTTSILAFGMQAYAEPRRDGVTAAFRSKTRRLLALLCAWRSHASHSWARRPSRLPTFMMKSDISQRRSLTSAWQLHSDAQSSSTLSERSKTDTQSPQSTTTPLSCSAHGSVAALSFASCGYHIRPRVLRQHAGHSGEMPAASIGQPRQPDARPRRAQRWGPVEGTVVCNALL